MIARRSLGQGSIVDPLFDLIEARTDVLLERVRPVLVDYVADGIRSAITPGKAIAAVAAIGLVAGLVVIGAMRFGRTR